MKEQAKVHAKAAEHHALVAKHQSEAYKSCESGDHKTVAHHAQIAGSHAAQAAECSEEAKKKYAASHHVWEAGTVSVREVEIGKSRAG